jgi:hypothetical protein
MMDGTAIGTPGGGLREPLWGTPIAFRVRVIRETSTQAIYPLL